MDDFDLRSRILTYSENAQGRIPHSKAFIIEVAKNESTFKISSTLEKLYFEGIDADLIDGNPLNNDSTIEDDNQLAGVIMIGDVPMPVVHEEDGQYLPSVYPYTDFYQKAYIYDHQTDQFEANQTPTKTPEVWHGLINAPNKDPEEGKKELIAFFDKNNDFTNGENGYADFEQRMLYANFQEMEKQMNYLDYGNYQRYVDYMEELVFKRFNKHLLKEFIAGVSEDMGSSEPVIDNASIDQMYDIYTENVFKQYALTLLQALKTYRGDLNEEVKKTGRWTAAEVDSPESLITLRDEYAKHQLHRNQLALEQQVDNFIEQNVPAPERALDLVTLSKLNVKLTILDTNVDNRFFDFVSYIDGIPMSTVTSIGQCGIQRGDKKDDNETVLENNSVLVNANRLYNPESLLTPPENGNNWQLKEQQAYKDYAGCVFNNSLQNDQTQTGPAQCLAEWAIKSVFDIEGSIEVKEGEPVYEDENRCSVEHMTFMLPNENQFGSDAALGQVQNVSVDQTLAKVIDAAYAGLQGNLPNPSLREKADFVVQRLTETQQSFSYVPSNGAVIEVSTTPQEKAIDSIYPHVEPTNETIQAIKHIGEPRVDPNTGEIKYPQVITPSLPADGNRLVFFIKNGLDQTFEYLNLFRIEGENSEQITENLLKKITEKQVELSQKTEKNTDVLENFFVQNSEVLEPLTWKASSLDQKLLEIIPKYINRDSFMPTPLNNPPESPQNKPGGYEVLHIVAEGDAEGYQFGINRAMQMQSPAYQEVQKKEEETLEVEQAEQEAKQEAENNGNNNLPNQNYICGDPTGVEIWEWFEATQCWLEEEVMPKQDTFAVSQMCSAAPLPPEEEPETEDIFDELLTTAADFEVEMKRKTLVVGQEQNIVVTALNTQKQPLMGYIDMPIHFELSDPSLGEFSENDVYIFSGTREVKFTPKKTGTAQLTITMGDLPPKTVEVTVIDQVKLEWSAAEKKVNGQSQFLISVTAVDENNETLLGLEDEIVLGPEQPADGGFTNGGKVTLSNGTGQIEFLPAPGKQEITLLSKDPFIQSSPFVIKPTKAAASQIVLKTSAAYLPIGEPAEIEVIVADEFGFPAENFNGTVELSLTESSQGLASLPKTSVEIQKGKGKFVLQAGKETADITVKASHAELKSGTLSLPLLARMNAEEWGKMYPQTLFASFVGFPAGDFTQENYFGGTHLMAGKTQAVYSFLTSARPSAKLTIEPNHVIRLTENTQTVLTDFSDNEVLFQVFDQKAMQTLFTKKETLNFDEIKTLSDDAIEPGKMYFEILDDNYAALTKGEGIEIKSKQNQPIAEIQKNKVTLLDQNFKWEYVVEPEFGAVELTLTDGLITPLRLILNFKPEVISKNDLSEINPNLNVVKNYGGKSLNDPTGVSFYNTQSEIAEEDREEFYGLEGDNKYISLFASGTNIGEAVKSNLPTTAILLGDPTIKLETKSNNGLNYNSAQGEKIYQDPQGAQIVSINQFSFNNDAYQDVAILLKDGRVRLLEGGPTEPPYKDRGDIALMADGGVAIESLNLKNDGYDDLLIATEDGRLAFLNNDQEVIKRSDQKLKVGKQIRKLILDDMDQDGSDDLVILDSQGDIYIFYYNPETNSFPQSGKLIGNYGFTLKLEENLNKDLDIRYQGMPEPQSLTDDQSGQSQVSPEAFEGGGEIDPQKAEEFYEKLQQESEALAQDPYSGETTQVPKLPWPEGNEAETYFAPVESIPTLSVSKKVSNKDRPGEKKVELEENLQYQIEISSAANFPNAVIADVLPDSLEFDANQVTCVEGGCEGLKVQQNGVVLFFSGLNLIPGQKTVLTYTAKVKQTPEADIYVQTIDEPNENLNNPNAIIDNYKDILVSPPFNNTGKVLIHYTTGPRTYSLIQSNDPEPAQADAAVQAFANIMKQMEGLKNGQYDQENPPQLQAEGMEDALDEVTGNNDCFEDPNNPNACVGQVLDDVAEDLQNLSCIGGGCFPMPFNQAFLVPPNMALPVFAFPTTLPTAVGPTPFVWPGSFIGASNVPGPISSMMRFYVSPTLTGGVGMAACWGPYPTSPTVLPPSFPIPYPPPTGNCMVTVIPAEVLYGGLCAQIAEGMGKLMDLLSSGVNKIDSSINSINNNPNLPLNVQPVGPEQAAGGLEVSLAVNLGKSLKFDPPVKTVSNIHLKSFDSVGGVIASWVDRQMLEIQNKLLTLPTVNIYLPDTKTLFTTDFERTQNRFTGWLNTMNGSAAATLDTVQSIGNQPGGSDEESYQSYLTDEVRSNPIDLNALTQKGVLQCDIGTLNEADLENGFQSPDCQLNEDYAEELSASEQMVAEAFSRKNGSWIYEDGTWYFAPTDNSLTAGQAIRLGLEDVSGSKALQYKNAIETQARVYNLNALEGLYDVASTLPLVKLTEKPVELKVPWLSAGQIQSYIIELQNWVIYYEQEYDRVKDKWEALKCDDQPDATTPDQIEDNLINCTGRKLADAFGANFDEVIGSAKQNIAVLQSYLAFPKELASYKQQLAGYVASVACYLEVIAQMMGGYLATIKQQMIQWAETILTIREVVKNIKELFDVFTNFETNCETCANERFANFGWWSMLGLVLPDLPVIQFPKIPDIVLDLSNTEMLLDIELPVLNIRPEPIPLPPLPYVKLPDFPNASVFLQVPPLPVLPSLPDLPDLPALPGLPTINLPTLPPPPKLPDVGKALDQMLPLIEKILQTWCIMKKSLAPVPEMALGDQIRLLTTRPAYLTPLDLLQVQAPKIALFDTGFNQVRIESIIYLGLRLNVTSKPLDELAETWNGWIEKIPETMNEAYKTYLEATETQVQGYLDEADSLMENAAQSFEEAFDQYVQGWLDKNVGDPMAEADKWLADKEAEWQKWADEQGIEISYEQYYTEINELYEKVRTLKDNRVSEWFDQNQEIIQGLNYLMPSVKLFEILADDDFKEYQQEMLDLAGDKLSQLGTYGPTLLPRLYACLRYYEDCRTSQEKYFGPANVGLTEEEIESLVPENVEALPSLPSNPSAQVMPEMTEEEYAKELLDTPEGKQIAGLFGEITNIVNELNTEELVDYTVLKEKFGVEDYEIAPRNTTVDKLNRMGEELAMHSEQLYAEAENLKHTQDLNAVAGVQPREDLDFVLASNEQEEVQQEPRVMTNAMDMPKLLANNNVEPIENQIKELQQEIKDYQAKESPQMSPLESTMGCSADLCLPDPITQTAVPVVPSIEMLPQSETLFMPEGNLVYSDGTGLYLKRDLTLDDSDKNTDTGTPQPFSLSEIQEKLRLEENPKEAINMFQSQFTQNGAATFNWLPPTNPELYGYGLELEKTITGFDANAQARPTGDTKIVLLPPDENGNTPDVFVGDTKVEFGTFITSLGSAEEAQKRFGIKGNTTITGASEVHFPTINDAKIDVSDYKAIYFDQLEGSGYSMEMENGFYQLKMTWFDQMARTATYNQNEVLAPQAAAGDAEPLIINQSDRFYIPLYKEKIIKGSDIFSDSSGSYNFYWFIGNDKEAKLGNQLKIAPQKELREINIKLVASQDIADPAAAKFEKEFTVEVYAPDINLNPEKLKEGIIAGNMSPLEESNDDLDGIPFSVFRKRNGTWKNLGLLHAQDETKTPTKPPLNDHGNKKYTYQDSYYAIGLEGNYEIQGFDMLIPSPLIIKDHQGNKVAEVMPGTGVIKLLSDQYELRAVAATETTPTRVVIILKATQEIIGNIYYIADDSKDITLVKTPLEFPNVSKEGVTIGDVDVEDDIEVLSLPKESPTFPGGAAVFNETTQKNIALIDKDGSIRLMDNTYDLSLKNADSEEEPYIFQIINSEDKTAEMDIFIQADWNHMETDTKTKMTTLNGNNGEQNGNSNQNKPQLPSQSLLEENPNLGPLTPKKPKLPGTTFSDVPVTHPYYDEIMELYNSDVVKGFNDNTFKPDQPLTRAEFIKIALGVTNCFDCEKATDPQIARYLSFPFPDVSLPAWYFYCVWVAKELMMITGYGDGQFRPEQNISRAEAAAILLRQSDTPLIKATQNAIKDVPSYAWYVDYAYTALQMGLIKQQNGFVKPDEAITRGEFAFMATTLKDYRQCRLVDEDKDGNFDWWEMDHNLDPLRPDADKACPCSDNPNQTDTDKDGLRDVCDLDIDNDGTLNPMCIFDDNGNFSTEILVEKEDDLGRGEKVDNCIFTSNPDQADTDNNGIGDICETCPCADNPNQTDTNGNGLKDACDNDIDGDGVKNPICIFDDNGLLDEEKTNQGGDNCLFVENSDQTDLNNNGIGDACESQDLCPNIPEDFDGVMDTDGCPDLEDNFEPKDPGVYVGPGPLCGLLDYKSDIMPGDIFMTAITDIETHQTVFSKSKEVTYQ